LRIGEALIGECLAWARTQGLAVVKLGVVTTNTSAIRCYARCGFTVFGVEPKAIFYDGVYYDELLMAKPV
jgi:RimJ/RimL family protein N-acetyltransferase